jgi:hypothetical protein
MQRADADLEPGAAQLAGGRGDADLEAGIARVVRRRIRRVMTQSVAERVDAEIGFRGLIIGDGTARQAFDELGHVVELPENLSNHWLNSKGG